MIPPFIVAFYYLKIFYVKTEKYRFINHVSHYSNVTPLISCKYLQGQKAQI